jgi:hypothetical protein
LHATAWVRNGRSSRNNFCATKTDLVIVVSFDLESILESKRALRRRLAASPISEKLRMLDALRERAVVIRGATIGESARVQERPLRRRYYASGKETE